MNFLSLLKHYQDGYTCLYEGAFSAEEISYVEGAGVVVEDKQYLPDGTTEVFTTNDGVIRLSVLFHTINKEKIYYKISVPSLEKHTAGEVCNIADAKKIILVKGLTDEETILVGKAIRNEELTNDEIMHIQLLHSSNKLILKIDF